MRKLSNILIISALLLAVIYGADRAFTWHLQAETDSSSTTQETAPRAPTLDLTDFNPGNLINDEDFYNAQKMTEEEVRTFIEKWNQWCVHNKDVPCLQEYEENIEPRPANAYCPFNLPGGHLDAAGIIHQVAQSCGINPEVLLTTLQKEQGLITASGKQLTPERYQIAMGYACPDHAKCDPQFFGFANQIYGAAQQFQRYRKHPHKYAVKPYQNNEISFSPEEKCGARTVYVENQATAGLYNYTPYQPTEYTISGGKDECSTWGNLNFYGLYKAWFK